MKKNSIFIIIAFILVVGIFAYRIFMPKVYAPAVTNPGVVDTTMPPIENKDLILGNKDDLISSSIVPNAKVHGVLSYRGEVKGGYFFEANIGINILDSNKNVIKKSNAVSTTDWMTAGPVSFEGNIDFTGLPSGPAYFEIHNDNASGLPENDKSILIPVIIDDLNNQQEVEVNPITVIPKEGTAPLNVKIIAWGKSGKGTEITKLSFGDGTPEENIGCYAPADVCISPDNTEHTYANPGTYDIEIKGYFIDGMEFDAVLDSQTVLVR